MHKGKNVDDQQCFPAFAGGVFLKKGRYHALYHCCSYARPVVVGFDYIHYHGWFHPHSAGDCYCGCLAEGNKGITLPGK